GVLQLFLLFLDHIGRGFGSEFFVVQLTFYPVDFLLQPVKLFVQALEFGGLVDQTRHGNQHFHFTHQLGGAHGGLVTLEPFQFLQLGQGHQELAVGVEAALIFAVATLEQHRHLFAGRDIHLATDVAHGHDHAFQPFDIGRDFSILLAGVRLRVGLQHDAVALFAGQGRNALPDFFGDERHHRMRQAQYCFENPNQRAAGAALGLGAGVVVTQGRLGQLQVPVAVFVPDELVQGVGGQVKAVLVQVADHFLLAVLQLADDPTVSQRQFYWFIVDTAVFAFGIHQYVAGSVPKLVTEVAVAFQALHVPVDVTAGGGHGCQGETQGVGAVGGDAFGEFLLGALADFLGQLRLHQVAGAFLQQLVQRDTVDHVQRVDDVTLGLGHLVAVLVPDQTGDVYGFERYLWGAVFVFHEVHGHHDHPGNPEEDDVETGHQHVRGVEGFQALGDFRPAQGAKGPQGGAEPGVQNVVVLFQFQVCGQVVLLAYFVFVTAHIDVAFGIVPGRNPVAPPELAGDTPVLDVAHPGEVHVLVLFGHKLDTAVFHSFDGGLGQGLGIGEPLVCEHRLDDQAGAVATGHAQYVVFDLFDQAFGFHVCHDLLAGGLASQAGIG